MNPLVSHEDGGQAKGAVNVEQTLYTRAHGSESKERRQIDRQRERERERERRLKRRFTGAWTQQGRALLLRLYACEHNYNYISKLYTVHKARSSNINHFRLFSHESRRFNRKHRNRAILYLVSYFASDTTAQIAKKQNTISNIVHYSEIFCKR